jgi:hypothetical protein
MSHKQAVAEDVPPVEPGSYPRLLWSPEGIEVTAYAPSEYEAYLADSYSAVAPGTPPVVTPVEPEPVEPAAKNHTGRHAHRA